MKQISQSSYYNESLTAKTSRVISEQERQVIINRMMISDYIRNPNAECAVSHALPSKTY